MILVTLALKSWRRTAFVLGFRSFINVHVGQDLCGTVPKTTIIIIREVPHYVKLSNFTLVGGKNP